MRFRRWLHSILLLFILAGASLSIATSYLFPPTPAAPSPRYDYYIIMDERDQHILMYVPVTVTVGDELITEENQRYVVVKVEENRAYARFAEQLPSQTPQGKSP